MFNISMSRYAMLTTLRTLREKAESLERETLAKKETVIAYPEEYNDIHVAIDDIVESCADSLWTANVSDFVDTLRYPLNIKWLQFETVTQDASDKYGMAQFMFGIDSQWIEKKLGGLPYETVDYATYETDTVCGNTLYIRI